MIDNSHADHIKFNADMEHDLPTPAMITSTPDLAAVERFMAEFSIKPSDTVEVTFTRAEATQLLALALRETITDRSNTVNRQLTFSAMRKLDGAL